METDFAGTDFFGEDFDGEVFLAIIEAEAPIPFDLGVDLSPLLESGFGLVIFGYPHFFAHVIARTKAIARVSTTYFARQKCCN